MKATIAAMKHHHASRVINIFDTLEVTNIVLLLLLLTFMLLLLWQQRKGWQLIWKLNGWRGVVQQSLLWWLLLLNLEPKSILQTASKLRNYFQRPLAIIIGTRLLLYVDDPATMEQVLNSHDCLDKTFLQNGFFAKNGLLHARAQKWKIRRKQLNPAFSQSIVLSFFDIFNSVGNQLQQKFGEQLQDTAIVQFKDVEDMLSRAVLEVSCLTVMGTATDFTQKDDNDIARTYKKLMELSAMKIIKPWLQWDLLFRLLDRKNYETSVRCNKLVQQFVNKIVLSKYQQWREEHQAQQQQQIQQYNNEVNEQQATAGFAGNNMLPRQTAETAVNLPGEMSRKRIFIEQLFHLATMGEMTLEDIMNEAESMVLVSFETISNSIIITLLLLAMHTDCQHKLRAEINENFQQGNVADISVVHLQQLKYLDMIVNESLRLLTTVPMNLRNVSKDFQLKHSPAPAAVGNANNFLVVPQNTIIVLDTFNMQRDELFWGADAKKFQPLHFAAAPAPPTATTITNSISASHRHPYAFIPFSKGLRTCIGGRYSFFLLKIFLIKLIANFEFSTTTTLDDLRYVEGISLKFLNADQIEFKIKSL